MAGSTLQVDPHQRLRNILRSLHLSTLAGVDHSAPLYAFDKALRFFRRVGEFFHHLMVGLIVQQRMVEPVGDLLAAAGDEAGAGIVVA